MIDVLLLPGLDGGVAMLGPFIEALGAAVRPRAFAYPPDLVLGYDALRERVPLPTSDFAIVAESFGGPLALKIAARKPPGLRAVVLVATFVQCPVRVPRALGPLVQPWWFRRPPPPWLVRRNLVRPDAPESLVEAVRRSTAAVRPEVFAHRMREVLRVDATRELEDCPVPVMYLAGKRDRLVARWNMERMRAIRPAMACRELDAPHLVLQSEPSASARAILAWLDTNDPRHPL